MEDLEHGINSQEYQKITKKEDDNEIKEELHLEGIQPVQLIDSPLNMSINQNEIMTSPHKKSSQQVKALVYKNLQLQSRQIGTNILQVF